MKARALTKQEMQERFLNHIRGLCRYWNEQKLSEMEKLEGVAFCILSAIDGEAVGLPACNLIPCPHPEDKEFMSERGENFYPEGIDIAGNLHEQFLQPQTK